MNTIFNNKNNNTRIILTVALTSSLAFLVLNSATLFSKSYNNNVISTFFITRSIATEIIHPGLHLHRIINQKADIEVIKSFYDKCVAARKYYIKMRKVSPSDWLKIKQDLHKTQASYNLDAPLTNEPNYDTLDFSFNDEYFYLNKYALYSTVNSYKISKNAECKLSIKAKRIAIIDDAEFIYYLNYENKTYKKEISPYEKIAYKHKQNKEHKEFDLRYPNISTADYEVYHHMPKEMIEETIKIATLYIIATENVANEDCDYIGIEKNECYWKTAYRYPSPLKRKIILKSLTLNINEYDDPNRADVFDSYVTSVKQNIMAENLAFQLPTDFNM